MGLDALGELVAVPLDEAELMTGACRDLAYNDALAAEPPRRLDFDSLHVMAVDTVEHLESRSSRGDADNMYGRLRGPIPGAAGAGPGMDGMLTACRAEVLQALAWSGTRAFHCAPGEGGRDARFFQLALAGESERKLAEGRGLVLGYPLFPAEVSFDDPSNDLLVSHIAHDTLRSLQEELAGAGSQPLREGRPLPVPSRGQIVSELRAQGFEIDEDRAFMRSDAGGLTGWLSDVFGVGTKTVDIPPEGTPDEFIALAAQGLALIADWPSGEARAIAARTGSAGAMRSPLPAPTARSVRVATARESTVPAWTDALVQQHRHRASARSHVMSSKVLAEARGSWEGDFENERRRANPSGTPQPAKGKRGWRTDFEAPTPSKPSSSSVDQKDWSDDFG